MSMSKVTTLGRGGSDTTAALTGFGAEYCEICSDVDGIYADPNLISDANSKQHRRALLLSGSGASSSTSTYHAKKKGFPWLQMPLDYLLESFLIHHKNETLSTSIVIIKSLTLASF